MSDVQAQIPAEKHGLTGAMFSYMFLWALFATVPLIIVFQIFNWFTLPRTALGAAVTYTLIGYGALALWLSYREAVGKGPNLSEDLLKLWGFCVFCQFIVPGPVLLLIVLRCGSARSNSSSTRRVSRIEKKPFP